jgi:tetratricopeptide (TPR) repeat protein
MATDDWFRNTEWNSSIEEAFFNKLGRARRKEQYLRIQASTLASSHPKVALRLLEEYFTLKDDFDHAQAHVDRATAYIALNRLDQAIASYESAIEREREFPELQTQAVLDLPFLIATRRIEQLYDRCIELLSASQGHLMFPVDHFRWHAANALILSARGRTSTAREHALQALVAARKDKSGFSYHPSVGLVGDRHQDLRKELERLSHA